MALPRFEERSKPWNQTEAVLKLLESRGDFSYNDSRMDQINLVNPKRKISNLGGLETTHSWQIIGRIYVCWIYGV